VVGVGAAPAWPLRYGRSCSAASQPARDRGPQGRTRRQSAPRAAEGITVAPRLVLVARLGLGATEPWTSAIVATARACCRFESCERAHAARQPRNCMARQGGGLARRLRHWGHDSKRQQALVPSLKRKPAALLDARSRQLRFALRCHEAFRDGLGDRNTSCDFEKLTFRVR